MVFEILYRFSRDPWNYDAAPYELQRYEDLLRLLRADRDWSDSLMLEVGCSQGAFTERLLTLRPQRLLATDISPTAVSRAARRLGEQSALSLLCLDMFRASPLSPESFDLIVAADVMGYVDALPALVAARDQLLARLRPGGRLLLGNTKLRQADGEGFEPFPSGFPLRGAHAILDCFRERMQSVASIEEKLYRLDLLALSPP